MSKNSREIALMVQVARQDVMRKSQQITNDLLAQQRDYFQHLTQVEIIAAIIIRDSYRLQGKALTEELAELSVMLNEYATHVRNVLVSDKADESELAEFKGYVSTIQDGVEAALKGDGGMALRAKFPDHPLGARLPKVNFGGRPEGLSPSRKYLAELAVTYRKKVIGPWWKVGAKMMADLLATSEDLRTDGQKKAIEFLIPYFYVEYGQVTREVTDKRGLGKYLPDLKRDYEKNVRLNL